MSEIETWANDGRGMVFILKFDHNNRLKGTAVRPGSKISVSTEERQINQERAYDPQADVFRNGSLTPVRILETVEDYKEIASNPNLLSEDDMRNMFRLKVADFRDRIAEINNPNALNRMKELAESAGEDDSLKVTVNQARAIDKRIEELKTPIPDRKIQVEEVTQMPSGKTTNPRYRTDPELETF